MQTIYLLELGLFWTCLDITIINYVFTHFGGLGFIFREDIQLWCRENQIGIQLIAYNEQYEPGVSINLLCCILLIKF